MKKTGLGSWFAIWHPRYRRTILTMLVIATVSGGLAYAQMPLLNSVIPAARAFLSKADRLLPEDPSSWTYKMLSFVASSVGIATAFVVLSGLVLVGLLIAAMTFWKTHTEGSLEIRAKDDVEREVLSNLLRKDDAFFATHSPGETVNRLSMDLFRVGGRRPAIVQVYWASIQIAVRVGFFVAMDWRLAAAALVGCTAGALWAACMTRPVKQMDATYMQQNDIVKSRLVDYLSAAPEVQVGGLFQKIRRLFTTPQRARAKTYTQYVRLSAFLSGGAAVCFLLALVAMLFMTLRTSGPGAASRAVNVIPVLLTQLPSLFAHASSLVFTNLSLRLARTSMDRLLEYESHEAEDEAEDEDAPKSPLAQNGLSDARADALQVRGVSYHYTGPDGTPQGGVAHLNATFSPGQWTAIVGGTGSGKSTLVNLLLGRLEPQDGEILYGKLPLDTVAERYKAALLSLMPQRPVLLDASIRENITFGIPDSSESDDPAAGLSTADIDILESSGLGAVCRLKALDLMPKGSAASCAIEGDVTGIRSDLRRHLRDACGVMIEPYEQTGSDPQHWLLEILLGGKCDRPRAAKALISGSCKAMKRLAGSALEAKLLAIGGNVLAGTRQLLGIPNYHVYCQLAPRPLHQSVWQLRSSSLDLAERTPGSTKEKATLCAIALTCCASELTNDGALANLAGSDSPRFESERDYLRRLLAGAYDPFDLHRIHPYLTWRENLVFGSVDASNSRASKQVDQTILDFIESRGLNEAFTRAGFEYQVGRLGGNLSGGQGQLVAFCRAALRKTPVLILDEPTSSLDPNSRSRLARFLQSWKTGRIIITVSHDPEFIKEADDIKLLDAGRLAASGPFEKLKGESEVFRRTLKQA